ncbi:acetate kinase [Lysinibacillus contaminans]|uniref:Acetate kinase n=1 Tax=Lysinibacillus contaminans TaxID=1293441 RepID=A0ABR5K3I0_9BACI|nr:acetate kinase [Lysinibacillus contaminans]KOS69487.1 acetate kinase [Lysinibacillus contaminans]
MTKVLAVNAGSSSLKFQLFNMPQEEVLLKGLLERIGQEKSQLVLTVNGEKIKKELPIPNHDVAVEIVLRELVETKVLKSLDELHGVGHRVTHGGELFAESAIINDDVIEKIDSLSDLAPLHNPANLAAIKAFFKVLPNIHAVAVFDTAFHQTMPKSSYLYSLPFEYYENFGIRKYGFHGTSHKYVAQRAAVMLRKPLEQLRLISCHLGNGSSIAAIEYGKSIDTTMGFTPLAGLTMGTRSGDIDPALIPYIMEKTEKSADEVVEILNKKSGLLALSGISSDLRDIEEAADKGDERANLALEVFASRIHKYIGSYAARMRGVDAIIFTAGIGENSDIVRARVATGLEFMGVYFDPSLNNVRGEETFISYPHSPVKLLIIPTNEEVMIARDTYDLMNVEDK